MSSNRSPPPEELRRRFWLNVSFPYKHSETDFIRAFLESHGFIKPLNGQSDYVFKTVHRDYIRFLYNELAAQPLIIAVSVQPHCLKCGRQLSFKSVACPRCGGPIEPAGLYDPDADRITFPKGSSIQFIRRTRAQ